MGVSTAGLSSRSVHRYTFACSPSGPSLAFRLSLLGVAVLEPAAADELEPAAADELAAPDVLVLGVGLVDVDVGGEVGVGVGCDACTVACPGACDPSSSSALAGLFRSRTLPLAFAMAALATGSLTILLEFAAGDVEEVEGGS